MRHFQLVFKSWLLQNNFNLSLEQHDITISVFNLLVLETTSIRLDTEWDFLFLESLTLESWVSFQSELGLQRWPHSLFNLGAFDVKGFQRHHINENNINHWSGTPHLSEMGSGVSVDCLSLIDCCLVIDFDSSLCLLVQRLNVFWEEVSEQFGVQIELSNRQSPADDDNYDSSQERDSVKDAVKVIKAQREHQIERFVRHSRKEEKGKEAKAIKSEKTNEDDENNEGL